MYTIVFKQIRTNPAILFPGEMLDAAFVAHFAANYINTGKFLNKQSTLSSDSLELTITHNWRSVEDYQSYDNDAWVLENFITPSIQYRNTNNISQQIISMG